ncbi:MAG: phycobiliprotein lyase [Oscillatoriales cyanobacterium RM1_1_9]|nr:phycobiliprotein lyase [Oscillatoriales cyanobacterium SM2_3_0]NJO45752.1 phycobiliprotein lyase [Oscillatoriales cyanobacterium RM2_1_1]NJO72063.1 phycobiliprotein lyase [Oscillatoriales cyanobacterium RM1_1_9]
MDIAQFIERSIGQWRSQRSVHHLAFRHFEEVISTIEIVALVPDSQEVLDLCQTHGVDPQLIVHPFRMSWQGESDWDEAEVVEGSTVLVPVPDTDCPNQGKLLRDQGYAETIPAIGQYRIGADGVFVLHTPYDRAMAEEKIWFASEHIRFRVSLIKTSLGSGVTTASFSSEVRSLS